MSRITTTPLVQLIQPSGVEMNAYLVLEEKPTQQEIKLNTVSQYVQQHPTDWKKRLERAELLYTLGRWEEAVLEYRLVIERQPQLVNVRLQLGKLLQLMGKEADAIAVYESVEEAQQRLQRTLKLFPQDLRSLKRSADYRCGRGLVFGKEGKQTFGIIQTMLSIAPDAAYGFDSLAQYHLLRGEWKEGMAVLRQFVDQRPLNPSGWYYYAQCLFHTGDYTTAAQAIFKAHKLYPNDCEIYRALCEILPNAGRLDELRPLVEEMLERFPQRWSVWATVGRVLVEGFQEKERGCRVSAKAVELQPQLADAWFRHGRVLALAGKHREAVVALEQGWMELPPKGGYLQWVSAAVWLGESYRVLGEEERSRKWWKEAFKGAKELVEFNRAIAHYWQGRALAGLGDVMGASEAYCVALSRQLLYPARGEVYEVLKRL